MRFLIGFCFLFFTSCALFFEKADLYSDDLPPAQVNTYYSYVLNYDDHENDIALEVSDGALPSGITLSRTGQLVGTPTESGVFEFEVTLSEVYESSGNSLDAVDILSIATDTLFCLGEEDASNCESNDIITDDENVNTSAESSESKADSEWFELEVTS